jgi:hypothetical protein
MTRGTIVRVRLTGAFGVLGGTVALGGVVWYDSFILIEHATITRRVHKQNTVVVSRQQIIVHAAVFARVFYSHQNYRLGLTSNKK